jgi:hypothetical protein
MRQLLASDYARGMEALRNLEHGADALVIGNSPWRKRFPVGAWFGPTIACNAYYRTADRFPAYLVAFDGNMISECVAARTYESTTLVLRANECHAKVLDQIPAADHGHWFYVNDVFDINGLCGAMAIGLAGWLGCASVTLVGFSLSYDNLFSGTDNYPSEEFERLKGNAVGARTQDVSLLARSIREFNRLSPGGSVHWVTPGDWMLAKLDQGAAVAENVKK